MDPSAATPSEGRQNKIAAFLLDILRGAAIGIAFIIPGFSGGSVAAILGVYERLVESVAGIFSHFRRSLSTLLPMAIGAALGAAALMFPIQWGLSRYPVPTVTLFVGLALGGLPAIKEKAPGRPTFKNAVAFLLPCLVAAGLAFLPTAKHAEGFLYRLDFGGYLLLFLVGAVAACALVVPGISGSMLLLIFGYYAPLVSVITEFVLRGTQPLVSISVLLTAGCGMLVGFFLISLFMRHLLKRFPRATYFAILGFVTGSVVAIYAPFARSAVSMDAWGWAISFALLLFGAAISLGALTLARRSRPPHRPK